MSEYWRLKCNTCDSETGESANHLDNVLLTVLQNSENFKKIRNSDLTGYIEFEVMAHGSEFIDFAIIHCGHDVIVLSEYGDYITKDGIKHKKELINKDTVKAHNEGLKEWKRL